MTVVLEPLRVSLLDQARVDADRLLADADERAAAELADADERGDALVRQARTEGAAAAELAGAYDHALARRKARALVLRAQRELYEELRRQTRAAGRSLRDGSGYDRLLVRLSAVARAQLGADAVLEVDPPGAGGVRASSGARRVDYTLDALAERCLERLGGRLTELWS